VRAEYLRLAAPQHSYWVYLGRGGEVRWLDRSTVPAEALATEPDAGIGLRALARVLGWLPIESQL
jgi:putative cardiolipin synthase